MDALKLAVQKDLELLTLTSIYWDFNLALTPKYWDFKCVPLCPVYVALRVSSMLVEHFTCLATSKPQHILMLANQKHLLILKSQVLFFKLYSGDFVLLVHP